MRVFKAYLIVFLSMVFISCHHDMDPDLDFVDIIYCTPMNPGSCLPLEISNKGDGWQATYVGANSNDVLKLVPKYSLDEDGDSLIVFNEYLNEEIHGHYVFRKFKDTDNDIFQDASYKDANGKVLMRFKASVICKKDIFITHDDIANSADSIASYYLLSNEYSPNQRDLNSAYLLHANPKTFSYPFSKDSLFEISTSPDLLMKSYVYMSGGGNSPDANYDVSFLQYKTERGIVVLDNISHLLYQELKYSSRPAWPICDFIKINQATIENSVYFLIEACYYAYYESSYNNNWDSDYLLSLFAFAIKDGKLIPAKILEGQSMVELVMDSPNEVHFSYNDQTKGLQIPIIDSNGSFTGHYKIMKLK